MQVSFAGEELPQRPGRTRQIIIPHLEDFHFASFILAKEVLYVLSKVKADIRICESAHCRFGEGGFESHWQMSYSRVPERHTGRPGW